MYGGQPVDKNRQYKTLLGCNHFANITFVKQQLLYIILWLNVLPVGGKHFTTSLEQIHKYSPLGIPN